MDHWEVLIVVDTLRGAVEIRREWCVWGQFGSGEENSGRNQKKKSISI